MQYTSIFTAITRTRYTRTEPTPTKHSTFLTWFIITGIYWHTGTSITNGYIIPL